MAKNRWWRAIDRSPTVGTLAESLAAHLAGSLLLIISVFVLLGGVLALAGEVWSGWQGRVGGVALVAGGSLVFAAGKQLLHRCEFAPFGRSCADAGALTGRPAKPIGLRASLAP